MSDAWAVALAVAAAIGALGAWRMPLWPAVALAALGLAVRRPAILCLGAALLASALGARSWAGLAPLPPHTHVPIATTATLVTDPTDVKHAVAVELRLSGGRRVSAFAHGRAAHLLRPLLAGERVRVSGHQGATSGRRRDYLAHRHIVTMLSVDSAERVDAGSPPARLANAARRVLMRGVRSFPADQQAMFGGFVLGDGRDQPPGVVDDFRGAGLTHLLVVSGQNVAFVLALFAPMLAFFGLRGRLVAGVVLLVLFGVLTRWEPSVLRAEAMASISMLATFLGRPISTIRVLALAVTGLLLVDPLLVGSVGFLLSTGACAGIALLARPLSRVVPLPLAVTLAAQVGVAPVLIPVFGGVPLASLPANLLAVPAAGPLMAWGMSAGAVAGVTGGRLAAVLHLPTRVLMAWIEGVAHWAAHLPLHW